MQFRDLWRWDDKVDRKTYAIVGVLAFAIKRVIDLMLASHFLHRADKQIFGVNLTLFNYWLPLGRGARLSQLSDADAKFLATMLLVAMPFIWIGLAFTVRRLRDAGQPVWLAALFFVPVVNIFFSSRFACFLRANVRNLPKPHRGLAYAHWTASSRAANSAAPFFLSSLRLRSVCLPFYGEPKSLALMGGAFSSPCRSASAYFRFCSIAIVGLET